MVVEKNIWQLITEFVEQYCEYRKQFFSGLWW